MGRKRTSTKRDLKIYVEGEILEKLNYFKVNKSLIFTDAALKVISQLEESQKIEKK